jgi:hypothetical protein
MDEYQTRVLHYLHVITTTLEDIQRSLAPEGKAEPAQTPPKGTSPKPTPPKPDWRRGR